MPDTEIKHLRQRIARRFAESTTVPEEAGWQPLTPLTAWRRPEDDPAVRQDAIIASYYYARRDPLYQRAIQLTRAYTFGRGLTWNARDPRVAAVLAEFMDDRDNAIFSRAVGQWELCERLLITGELFPVFFVNCRTGRVKSALVEPLEITEIITDQDNRYRPLYYRREYTALAWDWRSETYQQPSLQRAYYPDWYNRHPERGTFDEYAEDGTRLTRVVMTQLKVNSHGLRGLPPFYSGIPWVKAYKGFQEDRATLTLALATFAFKAKVRGNQAQIGRVAGQLGRSVAGRYGSHSADRERAVGAQPWVENDSMNLDQIRVDSGAANAYQDGRMLRQQVSAAVGITEPDLTGDPSIGNLASLTAMNGPQVKGFEAWQQIFRDFYRDVFRFVLEQAQTYGTLPRDADLSFEVDFPPIVTEDLPSLVNAVAQLLQAQSLMAREFIPWKRLAARVLQAFGEQDIDTALDELQATTTATPESAVTDAALPDAQAEALRRAAEALREAAGV